ncbi:uncharacterized protein BYT42DRAFT_589057 [Radiomyces spectabilis]|uniref:uncharacterized protein n=1 Tax=Radiomyces spectabilis TaxID=64574 RepID=UPI00221F2BB4|nr:uncharacterized protein BYT42DRAFT_589057 [Radiomyces spectabilis]KAI8365175.1 hypothetical protein BYT42DRAFT_589057 [Radiomyces spectabilis]
MNNLQDTLSSTQTNVDDRPPKDYDLPATIVIYSLMVILGIGLCFCLRRANRLIPNRLLIPLSSRMGNGRSSRGFDLASQLDEEEQQGLLSAYSTDGEEDENFSIDHGRRENRSPDTNSQHIIEDTTLNDEMMALEMEEEEARRAEEDFNALMADTSGNKKPHLPQ